jgi:ribosomal protein S18 acetylase RimI-like enzyme
MGRYDGGMALPVLSAWAEPSDLMRLFDKTDLEVARQLGEEEWLSCGAAFANGALPVVRAANHVREAALPPGVTVGEAVGEVHRYFEARGTRCSYWMMNRSAPEERVGPLVAYLKGTGYSAESTGVMYLGRGVRGVVREVGGLTIIPARASYRHVRELAADAARERGAAADVSAAVEVHTLCVDNPQCDAMLAIENGRAIGRVNVVSVGEMGRVENLYVLREHRGRGIGRTLMSRALESCARSLFRHVFLAVDADNEAAVGLYVKLGFEKIGEVVRFRAPG